MALINSSHSLTVRTPATEDAVTATVERQPCSSRNIAWELGLSQWSVLKVLHYNQVYPYHYSWSTFPDDSPLRMQSFKWLQHEHTADELFLHNILWTNNVCCTCEGVFNIHNSHLWAWYNPHAICEHHVCVCVCVCVSVWAGIIGDIVVGPNVLPERLIAKQYHNFLETVLPELLAVRQRWFQHNRVQPPYEEDVQQWLKRESGLHVEGRQHGHLSHRI
jgi:hypothetical protein